MVPIVADVPAHGEDDKHAGRDGAKSRRQDMKRSC